MDDAAIVGVLERVGELHAETQHARERRRVRAEVGGQQPAVDQFHRDVDLAVRFAHVVDRADVRMIQRRGGPATREAPSARLRGRAGVSRARNTTPIAPAPICSSTRYGPRECPIIGAGDGKCA
jgi:hypothetical protein